MQDKGTAIWVLAYFIYWLEVGIVLAAKGTRGELLAASKRRNKCPPVVIQLPRSTSSAEEALPMKAALGMVARDDAGAGLAKSSPHSSSDLSNEKIQALRGLQ